MATQTQVQNTILAAQLYVANLVNKNGIALTNGALCVTWDYINQVQRGINCISRQYALGDYTSTPFLTAYNCVLNFIGASAVGTINPNAQVPGITINNSPPYAPLILYKTDSNLIDAGGGNWYLPFLDNSGNAIPSTTIPAMVQSNGVSFTPTFDETFSPPRIYGFSGNYTQAIIVTCI